MAIVRRFYFCVESTESDTQIKFQMVSLSHTVSLLWYQVSNLKTLSSLFMPTKLVGGWPTCMIQTQPNMNEEAR